MIRIPTTDELKQLLDDWTGAGCGSLETTEGCLPLTALDVEVHVDAMTSETTVRQRFRNVFTDPLEATYVFPLPPRAAVTGFRMTVNDSITEGRIEERAKARADYDNAVSEGRTASIAEQERADVFTLRVGNIPPRSTAHIELILVAPLAVDSLEATYRFPLVVAPRYCPGMAIDGDPVGDGIAVDTDLVPDASRISPPVLLPGFKSPVKLGIRVRLAAAALAHTADDVPTPLVCTLRASEQGDADGNVTVTVMPDHRLDRDFILRWKIPADALSVARLFVEPDHTRKPGLGTGSPAEEAPGDGTFSLVIVPTAKAADAPRPPRDVVFMLDRSGSMRGWKMVAARRAVARMVDTLTAADRVSAMAFDDSVEHAGDTMLLAAATDRHRWSILEWLSGIEARGGTELAAAFRAGFSAFKDPDVSPPRGEPTRRDRIFVLITDCQVGDEDRVIADLVDQIGGAKLFVVGIDTAVNEGLLNRMTDSTGGMAEMVESEGRLDEVMERIQQRLAAPLATRLCLQAAGLDIVPESLVPTKLPNLFPGVPLVVRGRYRGEPVGGVSIEGRGSSGEKWRTQAEVRAASSTCETTLWASGRLRHLEDVYAAGNHTLAGEVLVEQMTRLSTAFGVLCRFTAIVAIDPRHPDRKPGAEWPRRIVQPVEQVAGSPGILYSKPVSRRCDPLGFVPPDYFIDHPGEDAYFMDPVEDAIASIAAILASVRPTSDKIRDVRTGKVRSLLKAVIVLLRQLEASRAPRKTIELLATAYERLHAMPTDRLAITALLDVLADIASPASPVIRWWHAAPRDASTVSDVPF